MQLRIDEVGEKKEIKGGNDVGKAYYPCKSDGKSYNVLGYVPAVGQVLEGEVRESQYTRNGRPAVSRWFTVRKPVTPKPQSPQGGQIQWMDYVKMLELAHGIAKFAEPDDAQARAAIVNTAMIAFTNGKIALPEREDEDPPPPDEEDYPL